MPITCQVSSVSSVLQIVTVHEYHEEANLTPHRESFKRLSFFRYRGPRSILESVGGCRASRGFRRAKARAPDKAEAISMM
jgi:hypothetical protein